MRECDFPIADEDFVRKLTSEVTVTDGLLRGLMLDRHRQDWTDKVTDNGKLLNFFPNFFCFSCEVK